MGTRTAVVVAAVLLVAAGATTATVAGGVPGPGDGAVDDTAVAGTPDRPAAGSSVASPSDGSLRTQVETDRIRLRIDVLANGTARWTVEYRTVLDDPNTTEAFESLQADIRENPEEFTGRFAARIRETVRSAENATGREMTARNFGIDTTQTPDGTTGVITYTYEWTNFAQVEDGGDRLVIGDAIEAYFLDSRSTMVISWPEGYERVSTDPEPDATNARSVSWNGEQNFLPGQPRVVVDVSGGTTAPGGDGDGGDAGDGGDGGGGAFSPTTALLVLVVLVVAAGGVFYFARGREQPDPVSTSSGESGTGSGAADPGDGAAAGAVAGGSAGSDAAGQEAGDADAEDDEPAIDEELLSNEERVLRLLEERGGRIKQQEVVQELDWTEAKTSQVVSGMRNEGTIDGFRLGRENVLTLPDVDEGPLPDDGDGDAGDEGDDDGRSWGDT